MPVKSAKQFRFMEMMAHGGKKKKGKGAGPSESVAKEFLNKTSHETKSKFAKEKR